MSLGEDRLKLVGGPYVVPTTRRGAWLEDAVLGRVQVGGYTAGLIPWPRRLKNGRASLILCGDLIEAVKTESEIAIAHWWGVSVVTVWNWRKALGVGRMTEGTVHLYRELRPSKLPEHVAALGRERAADPAIIERMAAGKRGKPAHPAVRAALLAAAKQPRSLQWRQQLSERNRRRHVKSDDHGVS